MKSVVIRVVNAFPTARALPLNIWLILPILFSPVSLTGGLAIFLTPFSHTPVIMECTLKLVEMERTERDNNPPPSLTGCLTDCQERPLRRELEISAH